MSNQPQRISYDEFHQTWKDSGGKEIANSQQFLSELCDLLGVPRPEPYKAGTENEYVFEREVHFHEHGPPGRIDLYRRGHFIIESKQGVPPAKVDPLADPSHKKVLPKGIGVRGSKAWLLNMLKAKDQAEAYARALPDEWPPFLIVCDVGYCLDLYADFSGLGKNYQQFTIQGKSRLLLDDLGDPDVQSALSLVWENPKALDPSEHSKAVTREVAQRLAVLAGMLEGHHSPEDVASFLMRCLFTMFAEDVGLLPHRSFTDLLEKLQDKPEAFKPSAEALWGAMNEGGFYPVLMESLLKFNGGLFADPVAIDLGTNQVRLLYEAALLDWQAVEPAIFGTLLERALDPVERHKLGAHYTPREYVERLIIPTVMEPLREEWLGAKTAAVRLKDEADSLEAEGKAKESARKTKAAITEVKNYHRYLCEIRILDPACGSGNFLYISLANMKELEKEVLDFLNALGESQQILELSGVTVDPHQFLGIEINPHAVAISDMVLWIGYLQWHFRTHGHVNPPEPVLKRYDNIELRDAVLEYDAEVERQDENGDPVTVWDLRTFKKDGVTGEDVPDESAHVVVKDYVNPRAADWPEADFVVSNPPFIGNKRMRRDLGDGYTECIRKTLTHVPGAADYVMYWWDKAARLVQEGKLRRFGLITTNSITQSFNRKVVEANTKAKKNPVDIVWSISNHPWIDSAEGAAVRIAMTIGARSASSERKRVGAVVEETKNANADYWARSVQVRFNEVESIHSDLTGGADVAAAVELKSNKGMAFTGMYPLGQGFVLQPEDLDDALGSKEADDSVVKPFFIARDLTQKCRDAKVIDFYPLSMESARAKHPHLFQHVLEHVKPQRDENKRKSRREKWWIFAEPVPALRKATLGLQRLIFIPRTAKHFSFQFVSVDSVPDTSVVAIASDDAYVLGVLSSTVHLTWAVHSGGRLGMGNDTRYQHKRTFNPFPFPVPSEELEMRIRELGEMLDSHRKSVLARIPEATYTSQYNALQKLRDIEAGTGPSLTKKERQFVSDALVGVLKTIHEDIDSAVYEAYGWPSTMSHQKLLERLVELNRQRASEESGGSVRWLRPSFQNPDGGMVKGQITVGLERSTSKTGKASTKRRWPKTMAEQAQAVSQVLSDLNAPINAKALARSFKGASVAQVEAFLQTLATLGKARVVGDDMYIGA